MWWVKEGGQGGGADLCDRKLLTQVASALRPTMRNTRATPPKGAHWVHSTGRRCGVVRADARSELDACQRRRGRGRKGSGKSRGDGLAARVRGDGGREG